MAGPAAVHEVRRSFIRRYIFSVDGKLGTAVVSLDELRAAL